MIVKRHHIDLMILHTMLMLTAEIIKFIINDLKSPFLSEIGILRIDDIPLKLLLKLDIFMRENTLSQMCILQEYGEDLKSQ